MIESEQGMFAKMATRTVDNLQVLVQNLHVRFESNNPHFSNDLFSMGATLEQLSPSGSWQPLGFWSKKLKPNPTRIHRAGLKSSNRNSQSGY